MKLQIFLAILLYILLYFFRFQQGPWEIKTDFFADQRKILDQKVSQFLPSPQAELLSGILLGNKKDLPPQFKLALRDTSTLHIVVVSGQNLTLVAGFLIGLAGILTRRVAILLSLGLIVFYTLLTGAQVPVLRAAIMVVMGYGAQVLGKENISFWALSLTAGLMVLVNPTWIGDLSFQLSFLATFGVIVVAPIFLEYLKWLPKIINQDLAITFAAQLMVIPVIASNFHQLSLVSVITNLLILWTVPFIMIGGGILLLVGTIWQFGGQIVALGLNVLLTYFVYIVEFFAHLPFAWQYLGEFNWIVWVGYYLILAGILVAIKRQEISTGSTLKN